MNTFDNKFPSIKEKLNDIYIPINNTIFGSCKNKCDKYPYCKPCGEIDEKENKVLYTLHKTIIYLGNKKGNEYVIEELKNVISLIKNI